MQNLYAAAHACLCLESPPAKVMAVRNLADAWSAGNLQLADIDLPDTVVPGRPERPLLLPPREMPRRRIGTARGQAAMIHAIGHIEFNAINLACDALYRFRGLPRDYYTDWVQVALEEAEHFSLIERRLAELGYGYGDFPAHDGLWDLARRTADDPLRRMALIPRVMEARGLDVTPAIIERFVAIGDQATADILELILREEVGHVAAGSRWFRYLCEQQGRDVEDSYFAILAEYFPRGLRCPLHIDARRNAGFSERELNRLEALCSKD